METEGAAINNSLERTSSQFVGRNSPNPYVTIASSFTRSRTSSDVREVFYPPLQFFIMANGMSTIDITCRAMEIFASICKYFSGGVYGSEIVTLRADPLP